MPELIYDLTYPINHLLHEVLLSHLKIGWTFTETQLTQPNSGVSGTASISFVSIHKSATTLDSSYTASHVVFKHSRSCPYSKDEKTHVERTLCFSMLSHCLKRKIHRLLDKIKVHGIQSSVQLQITSFLISWPCS